MLRLTYILLFFCVFSFAQTKSHHVYFDTDKHTLNRSEIEGFNTFIKLLDSLTVEKINIYGFCDDRGTNAYNLWLSKKRASAVKQYFTDNEFSEDIITVIDGKGEIALDSSNIASIDMYRRNNRRVEIIAETPKKNIEKDAIELPTTQDVLKAELKVGDNIRLKNVYFQTGYSVITPESVKTLGEIADILVEKDNLFFTIQGHVCCTHDTYDAVDRKTNKRNLSVARAKYIYNYLLKKGVSKHRMKFIGLRRKFPLGGKPKFDRRVEILITYISTKD